MRTNRLVKVMSFVAIVLFAGFILQSCDKTKPPTNAELEGYWVLKTINGQSVDSVFAGAKPSLEFNFADSTIHGTGGCNRYTGQFTYKEGALLAPNLATTRMLCVEKNMEGDFLTALSNAKNTLSIVNGVLTLTQDKKVVLEFVKGTAEPELLSTPLTAETLLGVWELTEINSQDAAKVFTGVDAICPTIEFNFDQNKVFGTSGCNNYNATFTLTDAQLAVGPIMSTMAACPNLSGEGAFTKLLADTSMLSLPSKDILQFSKNGELRMVLQKVSNDSIPVK